MEHRHIYILTGQVQGVGFRPFIYRQATALGLSGFIENSPEGVHIEVQGCAESLDAFALFPQHLPPLAHITSLRRTEAAPKNILSPEFHIRESQQGHHHGHHVLVSPDMAPCRNCLADMSDPHNRRFGYAFTNCTNCGPRYSITRSIPYDRAVTSMACFPLCSACSREYHSPADRRFHAQPNACPSCGPQLWLEEGHIPSSVNRKNGIPLNAPQNHAAILSLLSALKQGKIAAVKGLGGFHLVCDAYNSEAVAELRRRKRRPHKALAIMTADLSQADCVALLGDSHSAIRQRLLSPERPIVVCPRKKGFLPDLLAPDTSSIGIMLPSTPLHHLLFHPEWIGGLTTDALSALVMTSGNIHGDPICLGNREARQKLSDIADIFLFHDRDILIRVDDSVVFPTSLPPSAEKISSPDNTAKTPFLMIRRARGFVPSPCHFPFTGVQSSPSCILAAGAELKHTFCLTRKNEAFLSQHIGSLNNPECMIFFEQTLQHLTQLLEVTPHLVVRDLHPDYLSSQFAETFAQNHQLPVITIQHHVAHICAVMAEHGIDRPVLGLALDGSGLGDDGTIWGGELLLVHPGSWKRLGRFSPFVLPGGEAAIRSPWRTAEALWQLAGIGEAERPWSSLHNKQIPLIQELIFKNIHCAHTSSCGRLFDAISALCGLCFDITYEGQAAIRLEEVQDITASGEYTLSIKERCGLLEADVIDFFQQAANDRNNPSVLARRFHKGLAQGLARWTRLAADKTGITDITLAGGVFNNRTLLTELPVELIRLGLTPHLPSAFPAGDGSIALGQAFWGYTQHI